MKNCFRLRPLTIGMMGLALITAATAPAREPSGTGLTIVAEGVRSSRGVVGVLIFNSDRGWPENVKTALRSKATPAQPGITTLTFEDLPPGHYAAVLLHDENENMKLDKNFIGIPREGWGMSNNPKARGAAPAFTRARFDFQPGTRLNIRLNY